jgi:hypothetical protein
LAFGEQFGITRVRLDHAGTMCVEELRQAELPLLGGQRFRRFQADIQVAVARLFAREGIQLHEQ